MRKRNEKNMEHTTFWREFFQLYKELPALWRVRSTAYTDRGLKSNCYLKLIRKLKEIYPDADREMVVKKINNFRTSYRKELKRLKESKQMGKIHKPTLWYFDCLRFLDDQEEFGGDQLMHEDEKKEEEFKKKQNSSEAAANRTSCKTSCADVKEDTEEFVANMSKRNKYYPIYRREHSSKRLYQAEQQAKLEADILAKSWALQYKEMQRGQRLIARKLISDILFYGCLGTLNKSHAKDLQEILHNEQITWPICANCSERAEEHEYINYDSVRESPSELNSCSPALSPTINSVAEFPLHEIKLEVP